MQNATILERATEERQELFWSKVDVSTDDGCWTWNGALNAKGYGVGGWHLDGQWTNWRAHRVAYLLAVGMFADELTLDHLCRNRSCVNPSHLEPVTGGENKARATPFRTHCAQGHELSPENVKIIDYRAAPYRQCRACLAAWKHATYIRAKAA